MPTKTVFAQVNTIQSLEEVTDAVFNKIERCWSWLKHRIRQCLNEFDCLRDAMNHILKLAS
jgi:hypothetical protein